MEDDSLSSLLKTAMEDFISHRAIKLEFIDLEESVTNRTVHKSDGGPLALTKTVCSYIPSTNI